MRDVTVIGITGHRGSGKTSIGYLLGNILNSISRRHTKEEIFEDYKNWCVTIKQNNNAMYDCCLDYIYFDEFGEMPKSFVAQLLAIDISVLDNDTLKDTMYVNMGNFKLYAYDESMKIINAEGVLSKPAKKWKDTYISLREFIKVFSIDIMQRFFGSDVWLKSRRVNEEKWNDFIDGWKLFTDVKTKEEINYIKDNNGIIIRTIRPTNRKKNEGITNTQDVDSDFIINTEGQLIDLFDKIYELAIKIYEYTR
jgi:hypothetical protein